MNKITLESRTDKPLIYIPPYDGLGSFKVMYNHNLKKPVKNVLKIILTMELHLVEEFTGDNKFKIMEMVSKYRVNIEDKLEIKDLTKIWFDCAENIITTFNAFEKIKFGKTNEIEHSSEEKLIPMVSPLVDWYNSLP